MWGCGRPMYLRMVRGETWRSSFKVTTRSLTVAALLGRVAVHFPDERADVGGEWRTAGFAPSVRLPAPEGTESRAMPAEEGFGFDDDQGCGGAPIEQVGESYEGQSDRFRRALAGFELAFLK